MKYLKNFSQLNENTKTKEEKKLELIEALKKERSQFIGRSQDTEDLDKSIAYLETGSLPAYYKEYELELLDACINDFEMTYSDYCE